MATLVPWRHPAPVTISLGWLTPFKVRQGLPYTNPFPFKSWYFSDFSSEILVRTAGRAISVRLACLRGGGGTPL